MDGLWVPRPSKIELSCTRDAHFRTITIFAQVPFLFKFGPQQPPKIHPKSIEKSINKSIQFCIGKSAKFHRTMGPRWRPKESPTASKNVNLEVPWGVFFRPSYTSSSIAIKTRSPAPRDAHNTSWGTPNPIKFDGNCVVWDLVRRPLQPSGRDPRSHQI